MSTLSLAVVVMLGMAVPFMIGWVLGWTRGFGESEKVMDQFEKDVVRVLRVHGIEPPPTPAAPKTGEGT